MTGTRITHGRARRRAAVGALVAGAALLAGCGGSSTDDVGPASPSPSTSASGTSASATPSAAPSGSGSPAARPTNPLAGPHTAQQLAAALITPADLGPGWTAQEVPAGLADSATSLAESLKGLSFKEPQCQRIVETQIANLPSLDGVPQALAIFNGPGGLTLAVSLSSLDEKVAADQLDAASTFYETCRTLTIEVPVTEGTITVPMTAEPLDVEMPGFRTVAVRTSVESAGLTQAQDSVTGVAGDLQLAVTVGTTGATGDPLATLRTASAAMARKALATLD
jgi:hypothetical protein